MNQVGKSNASTIMKAASDINHVEKAENGHPDIKSSDTEVGLPVDIHVDNIDQGKVAEGKHTGTKEPRRMSDLLINNQSVDKIGICKPNLEDTNKNNADMYREEMVEDMQPDDKESGKKSDVLAKNHSVVIGVELEIHLDSTKNTSVDLTFVS